MNDFTSQLLIGYNQALSQNVLPENKDSKEMYWPYLMAAAVLHCFDPNTLQPIEGSKKEENVRSFLFDFIVPFPGAVNEGLFMLKPEIRSEALQRFSSNKKMKEALALNQPGWKTSLQQMLNDYLSEKFLPNPERLSYTDAINYQQLLTWFSFDKDAPSPETVLPIIRRKSVFAGFEHLMIDNFTGRKAELNLLEMHALGSAGSLIKEIGTFFGDEKYILALHGPGGVGKSALIGRFLWQNAQKSKKYPLLFAYLTFDDPALKLENLASLLVEAVNQLSLQLPEFQDDFDNFNNYFGDYRKEKNSYLEKSRNFSSRSVRLGSHRMNENSLVEEFGYLLQRITRRKQMRFVLVLDTFEEVQYRDKELLFSLWRMLDSIKKSYDDFRVIIAGRSEITDKASNQRVINERTLNNLLAEDAVELLKRLGVKDEKLAEQLFKQVGGNPLSIRLAANVARFEGAASKKTGIRDIVTNQFLFFRVSEELIQGQLYQRILAHIHDPNVRILAHPGMILRKTSPALILNVLAPACGIKIESEEDAEYLFEQLRQEHALVRLGDANTLIYRTEVRQAMMKLLKQDKPEEFRKINRAAINYYANNKDFNSRTEEMYHRLLLGEDEFHTLDERWQDGVEQSIAADYEDFSDTVKIWLASRLGLEISRAFFGVSDVEDWERNVTRKIKRAIIENALKFAFELVSERSERSDDSPIFALEARLYLLQENYEAAARVLQSGINHLLGFNNRGRLAELWWLLSQINLIRQRAVQADDLLAMAQEMLRLSDAYVPLAQIIAQRILLRMRYPSVLKGNAALLATLNDLVFLAETKVNPHTAFIISLSLTLLGSEYPYTLAYFAEKGITPLEIPDDLLTTESLRGIEPFRQPWENEDGDPDFYSLV